MPSDALAELTRLQESEERAAEMMEEYQRQLATFQALPANLKGRRGGLNAAAGPSVRPAFRAHQSCGRRW
jgi:hypothetical protein